MHRFQIFSSMVRWLSEADEPAAQDDPLRHPAIASMTPREVADLPLAGPHRMAASRANGASLPSSAGCA